MCGKAAVAHDEAMQLALLGAACATTAGTGGAHCHKTDSLLLQCFPPFPLPPPRSSISIRSVSGALSRGVAVMQKMHEGREAYTHGLLLRLVVVWPARAARWQPQGSCGPGALELRGQQERL